MHRLPEVGGPVSVSVRAEIVELPFGDYTLKGWSHVVAEETKRSIREMGHNVGKDDWPRFGQAMDRLACSTLHPTLWFDLSWAASRANGHYDPILVKQTMYRQMAARNVNLVWLPRLSGVEGRRILAGEMLNHMLSLLAYEYDYRDATLKE